MLGTFLLNFNPIGANIILPIIRNKALKLNYSMSNKGKEEFKFPPLFVCVKVF